MLEEETLNAATVPTLSHPGLLVMDVDSTLIDEEVIDELGVAAGVGDRIASVTARAMNGELDFRDALRARVALLKDLPISMFDDVYHAVHFTNGALALIDALHDYGWKVGVVSGGF
ncbi:MAG: haloacid dehalogenase-like hydrolase, partial [Bifidobacterium dentium]